MSTTFVASVEAISEGPQGTCALTLEPLNTARIIGSVGDVSAGATAIFIGTTRNSFKGKTVTRLEYQAYSKMAIQTMLGIVRSAHALAVEPLGAQSNSPLIKCAVYHRLGVVPVGEPSIVIAVSSPHRKEAFKACEFILEEVKSKAQIWKREFYEGETEEEAEWKAN